MLPTERIARFFLKLAIAYALLIAPWPGIMNGYAVFYRGVGNVLFGSLGSVGTARFMALSEKGQAFDSQIVLRTRNSAGVRSTRSVPFHSRRTGYLPTAELVALVLATPFPWRRRWKAMAWSLLWIASFVASEAGITILYSLTDERLPALNVSAFTSKACAQIYEMAVVSPTVSLVVPVLIWLLVCFRPGIAEEYVSRDGRGDGLRHRPAGPPNHEPERDDRRTIADHRHTKRDVRAEE